MTRITNADHVLLLLRNHLERTEKGRRKRGKANGGEKRSSHSGPLERVERLAAAEELSDVEIQRALISGLLAEEFGDGVVNDARFQRIVDEVLGLLRRDPNAEKLLQAARTHLLHR